MTKEFDIETLREFAATNDGVGVNLQLTYCNWATPNYHVYGEIPGFGTGQISKAFNDEGLACEFYNDMLVRAKEFAKTLICN